MKCAFILLVLIYPLLLLPNKIIYLISPPRSLSVAFLRMMEARGDFAIFHEPSQWPWDKIHCPELAKDWFRYDVPQTFAEVKQALFAAEEHHNVFVKDMSFAVCEFLVPDTELVEHKDVYFIFLVRNPHHSIISLYKKLKMPVDTLTQAVGYKTLYELYVSLSRRAQHKPLIVKSEDLYTDPVATIERFCSHVAIPFKHNALSWATLDSNFDGQAEWHEPKTQEVAQQWHAEAFQSTQFTRPTSYEVDEQGNPTFSEIANPEHRAAYVKAYEENFEYYKQLLQYIQD